MANKKVLHLVNNQAGKLHCDNVLCGYTLSETLPFTEKLIGYPCPKCGSDMLTRKDYEGMVALFKVINWINKWFGWLGSEEPDETNVVFNGSITYHDGQVKIKE